MYEIRHYLNSCQNDIYLEWRRKLQDRTAAIAIDRRINRMELGNFGDHKYCRDGVWELRVDIGPSYRIYYALEDKQIVLLLCGGDKRKQSMDISRACKYWRDWQKRSSDER